MVKFDSVRMQDLVEVQDPDEEGGLTLVFKDDIRLKIKVVDGKLRRYVWEQDISVYLNYNNETIPPKSVSLKNKKSAKKRAKNGKRYYGIHKDLADKGLYIHSGFK